MDASDSPDPAPVPPPPKIAVVVRDDLATWQALNVTAFLVSGIGTRFPDLIGEPYVDASGATYLSMFGHPVLVFSADAAAIDRAATRTRARGLAMAVYTDDLFATDNDVDNRGPVAGRHRRRRPPPRRRQGARQAAAPPLNRPPGCAGNSFRRCHDPPVGSGGDVRPVRPP